MHQPMRSGIREVFRVLPSPHGSWRSQNGASTPQWAVRSSAGRKVFICRKAPAGNFPLPSMTRISTGKLDMAEPRRQLEPLTFDRQECVQHSFPAFLQPITYLFSQKCLHFPLYPFILNETHLGTIMRFHAKGRDLSRSAKRI